MSMGYSALGTEALGGANVVTAIVLMRITADLRILTKGKLVEEAGLFRIKTNGDCHFNRIMETDVLRVGSDLSVSATRFIEGGLDG